MLQRLSCCLIAGVLLWGAAGCSYDSSEVNAFLQRPRSEVSGTEYRVLPPDVIVVSSRRIQEVANISQQVRPDGRINLPLLGEISVAGQTPQQIEVKIINAAKDYYQQADATVTVAQYNSQKFYVFGQVAIPGPMPWTGRDTLLSALSRAQLTNLSWPERVLVVRPPPPAVGGFTTSQPDKQYEKKGVHAPRPDMTRHTMTVNLEAMVRTGDMANNILLQPEDMIYVQPHPMAAIGLAIEALLYPVRPVLEAVRVPAAVRNAGAP